MWSNNNSSLSSVQQRRWLKALTKLVLNISNLFEEVVYFLSLNKHLGKKQRGSTQFFICKFLLYEKSRLYTYDNLVVYLPSQKLKYKRRFPPFLCHKKSKAYNWNSSFFKKIIFIEINTSHICECLAHLVVTRLGQKNFCSFVWRKYWSLGDNLLGTMLLRY